MPSQRPRRIVFVGRHRRYRCAPDGPRFPAASPPARPADAALGRRPARGPSPVGGGRPPARPPDVWPGPALDHADLRPGAGLVHQTRVAHPGPTAAGLCQPESWPAGAPGRAAPCAWRRSGQPPGRGPHRGGCRTGDPAGPHPPGLGHPRGRRQTTGSSPATLAPIPRPRSPACGRTPPPLARDAAHAVRRGCSRAMARRASATV